ncbi:DUF4411 family protein [Leptospira interrogans]|uniref:PF14367 domain protein n=1 Tax=Leptospira interrogans str. UI 12758 TaxID=1049938 RepID=A0A0E2D5K9_LEPIR|nr:DUF4411 family protein [Leptospira interrogans]EKR55188.1 PF14367 domain protein [Leptospira interrogans str. UI 12758]EMN33064.1 PF14367 domain protein [Leptospira interrogans serovar Medanensis str. L0448]UNE65248.1 DUF4411 family protein [Leptospira interrogans]
MKYCLDTNFFIQAWNFYYSPDFCNQYWEIIEGLGRKGIVFIPQAVKDEIDKIDDTLKNWLNTKKYFIRPIDENVQVHLRSIYEKDPLHERLVDSSKGRSIADPWVIAHAMSEDAVVVTKEEKIMDSKSTKIKIPNVCDTMGVKWMNDFDFIREHKIQFNCIIP